MQIRFGFLFNALAAGVLLLSGAAPELAGKTQNVVLNVRDGQRWQEIITGADAGLLKEQAGSR